jgi:hypothetical protein
MKNGYRKITIADRKIGIALIFGIILNLFTTGGMQTFAQNSTARQPQSSIYKKKKGQPVNAGAKSSTGRQVSLSTSTLTATAQGAGAGQAVTPPKVIDIPNDQILPASTPVPSNHGSFSEIGLGTAIIFTPDLAGEANRRFYEALGFLYLEDTNWQAVLNKVLDYNVANENKRITKLLLETHGNWGNGLKLQDGKEDHANRSYISIGGLQEKLDRSGIKECIISACNSGRLYRPEIYSQLNRKDLLPANQGVINASRNYRPSPDSVKILRRKESRFEALTPLYVSEMPKILRDRMGITDGKAQIIVSDLFLEFVLGDPNLNLIEQGFVRQVSIYDYSVDRSAALIERFLQMLEQIAKTDSHDQDVAKSK